MPTTSDGEEGQQGTGEKRLPSWESGYKFWGRSYTNCYRVVDFYLLEAGKRGDLSLDTITGGGGRGRSAGGSAGGGQVARYEFRLQAVSMTRSKPVVGDSPCVIAAL